MLHIFLIEIGKKMIDLFIIENCYCRKFKIHFYENCFIKSILKNKQKNSMNFHLLVSSIYINRKDHIFFENFDLMKNFSVFGENGKAKFHKHVL